MVGALKGTWVLGLEWKRAASGASLDCLGLPPLMLMETEPGVFWAKRKITTPFPWAEA